MILYGDVLKFATLFMNDDVLSSICEVLGNQQSCEEWLVAKEAQGICKLRSDSSKWSGGSKQDWKSGVAEKEQKASG